ncbi:ATP-binding protein [Clostridium beijerinckii]|uniref:histidine kinase n=3 Tax=Clostridium beijerinckii TaxID=1520 RepID=A0AAE2RNM0_CLOBE|nr:ATP-binding protein [Clostridium beijerinckii]ABR36594.1 multi-sensor signal transduction histidine kinase [Clostridium beijerinckii NCIMB 8052]AIU04474.1 multi-sensor signal transduction histidine kinase [Clostridium beijerinckii ATCC 35702]MBF7808760.1 PAS domain S-box protein [Clostridium beijerinckii]NRT22337.1 PAS domain S-box-containing protein [Clostridium beijerinckii]NRT83330.1 PAS domain S-box-containing protein [Clostridium beijerinckii]
MSIKKKFRNMKIKRRFTISTLTVVIITMLIFEIIRIIILVSGINKDSMQKVETITRLAALSYQDPIWNLNIVGIKEISDALFEDEEIGYIQVKAKGNGEIYNKYKKDDIYSEQNLIIKKVNVLKDEIPIGEVTIGLTRYYKSKVIENYIIATIIRLLVMVLLLWLAISIVSRIVTKSIYELSVGTDEISNGNLTHRLFINSRDEIGELAIKFNNMAQTLYNMIKQRNEAINELKYSEEKFNKAFNYSADVIAIVRLSDKLYIEINQAFLRTFGYKREEIIGHYSDEFNLWENEEHRLKVIQILDSGGMLRNEEITWNTKYGEVRVGLFSTEIIEIDCIECVIFVWNDITERKKISEELKRVNDELEDKVNERTKQLMQTFAELEEQHNKLKSAQSKLIQSEKMASLGTLVAGVAHEINNPINYIYLSSKVLDMDLCNFKEKVIELLDNADDDVLNFFEQYFNKFSKSIINILDGSNQVTTIVNDLRLFSRLDEAVKKEIDVSEALETTIRLVKTKYTKQIKFIKNFQTHRKIECYPSQLNQVFLNIIVNACHAIVEKQNDLVCENNGLIGISVFDNNKEIIIEFCDNGCGMTKDTISRIFEPFFTTKPMGQGTGLGMSISYGIIEKHNGSIDVESKVGEGSTITIHIPY